jgi:hypothetical protein
MRTITNRQITGNRIWRILRHMSEQVSPSKAAFNKMPLLPKTFESSQPFDFFFDLIHKPFRDNKLATFYVKQYPR